MVLDTQFTHSNHQQRDVFATLRTSGNALTLLSTGPHLSLCATSSTTWFSHPKKPFYCNLISSSSHSPKHLWQTVNKLLHHKSSFLYSRYYSRWQLCFITDKYATFICLSSNSTTGPPSLIRRNSFSENLAHVQSKPICTTQHHITVVKRYWMILQKISACPAQIKFIYQFSQFTPNDRGFQQKCSRK